jgi:hypothetical protein
LRLWFHRTASRASSRLSGRVPRPEAVELSVKVALNSSRSMTSPVIQVWVCPTLLHCWAIVVLSLWRDHELETVSIWSNANPERHWESRNVSLELGNGTPQFLSIRIVRVEYNVLFSTDLSTGVTGKTAQPHLVSV